MRSSKVPFAEEARSSVADYDYDLPEGRIAQAPLPERDASRLMVLPRGSGAPTHRWFRELPELLSPGDLLVVNDAKVRAARLWGHKTHSGGRVEMLLLERTVGRCWKVMCGSSKPLRPGGGIEFEGGRAQVVESLGEGLFVLEFDRDPDALLADLEAGLGEMPLPPYIARGDGPAPVDDRERYQTIFATRPGAVAAPTAGLHFTERILVALEERGVGLCRVTLQVGPGTFLPVRVEALEEHRMHAEAFDVPPATASRVAQARAAGGRILAVGTTVLRTLEAAWTDGEVRAGSGRTDLFVRPGYALRAVDGLLTNFHLPRSTLLMLVSALAGRERVLGAYAEAVRREYRFYSYGDAMLLMG